MMFCQHCNGQMLRQQELGEEPYFKCLQCARVVYGSVPQPALSVRGLLPRLAGTGSIAISGSTLNTSMGRRRSA